MALFKKKKKEKGVPEPPDFLEFPEVEQYREQEDIPDFEEDGHLMARDIPEMKPEDFDPDKLERESFTMPAARIEGWEKQEKKKPKKLPVKLTKKIPRVAPQTPMGLPRGRIVRKSKAGGWYAYKSLFIKVEKFKEIVASIQLISRKVSELEDIAQKIKETKAREDSEIADWEEQLAEIKARIEAIEGSLESKV